MAPLRGDKGEVEVSRGTHITDEVIGYMLVYVDDTMAIGPAPLVEKVFEVYKSMWGVTVTGILVSDDGSTEFVAPEIRFLGCTIKRKGTTHTLDQIAYIEERLLER